jgi:hypothetical protein
MPYPTILELPPAKAQLIFSLTQASTAGRDKVDARAKTGVSIRSAGKRYGQVVSLDDVSLDIGGIVQPNSSAVSVGESDITFAPPHRTRRPHGVSELRPLSRM